MAKEADVKSPKRLFAELYGEPVEPKKTPKFIHAEKREKIVPATPSNTDLSELLDELTEESPFRSDAKSDAKNIS